MTTKTEMGAERERLFEAVLVELDRRGRSQLRLDSLLARAEVSSAFFAESFADLDECLEAAYRHLTSRLTRVAEEGCESAPPGSASEEVALWMTQVQHGVDALLGELAANPSLTHALTVAFPSLGPSQQALYRSFVEGFGSMVSRGRRLSPVGEQLPGEVEMLAVGAVEAIVFEEVVSGRTRELPEILPAVVFSLLVPFVGPNQAAAEMERARRDR